MPAPTLSPGPTVGDRRARRLPLLIAAAGAAFAVLLSIFWVGFLGSDDTLYWEGASGWLRQFPYIGATHWALRHTLVLPIALSRLVFGDGITAMVTPNILYAIGVIAIAGLWIGRNFGTWATAAALALLVTNPQFILLSSSAYIDIVEIFYVFAALFLFHEAIKDGGNLKLLFASGFLLGLAMLSRETTAFAVAAVLLLFLAGFGMHRLRYFVIGAGFALPVGLEWFGLWQATGQQFYRSNISIHHDSTIDRWVPQGAAVPLIHPAIDPFIMLLLNHNFALLFWLGPPLVAWLLRQAMTTSQRRLLTLAATFAAVWVGLAAFMWRLLPLTPRYYLLPALLLALLCGVAIATWAASGARRRSAAALVLLLCANLAAVSLDNRHYMWGEHRLVEFVRDRPAGIVHTSPQTLRRAHLLLAWAGLTDRVADIPPAPGDLYYDDPTRAEPGAKIDPAWPLVERLAPPESAGQWLLRHTIGQDRFPTLLWEKLGPGHPPVMVYRVSPG